MYRLTTSLPYLMNRAGVRIGEAFSRELAKHDITLVMYRVLAALAHNEGQAINELASITTTEVSRMSRLIVTMKKRRLVSRRRSGKDARVVRVSLTEQGRALVNTLMPLAEHYEKVATQTLSAAQIEQLKSMLRTIYDNISALEPEAALPVEGGTDPEDEAVEDLEDSDED